MPILLLGVPWPAPQVPLRTGVGKRFAPLYPIIYVIPVTFLGELCVLLAGELIPHNIFVVSL